MNVEPTPDPQDTRPLIKSIDLMSIDELLDHLAKWHKINLSKPDAYLPGHRRNHAERLHSADVEIDDHRHQS